MVFFPLFGFFFLLFTVKKYKKADFSGLFLKNPRMLLYV